MIDEDFSLKLIKWYQINKRDLPWRKTKNPYKIWISEIILQQTRVLQGLPYYIRFIEKFPDVKSLAQADEEEVLKTWQGLGYYSRARNLHFTAKYISNELKGIFPNSFNELIQLKGIGEYTASAIASFAFNERKAVLDGNVFRLLSRYFGLKDPIDSSNGKKAFKKLANQNLPKINFSVYNQAVMEYGALLCKPSIPKCEICDLKNKCWAYRNTNQNKFPVKLKKIKVKERYFNYLVLTDKRYILIEKRTEKDIWQNLYQFPLFEAESIEFQFSKKITKNNLLINKFKTTHKLSHQKLNIVFWHFQSKKIKDNLKFKKIYIKDLSSYPIPKIVENYIIQNTSFFRL